MSDIAPFLRLIQKGNPVLWVGAGLSIQAGYPTIGQLAERLWAEHAIHDQPDGLSEYQLVDAFYHKYGPGPLGDALSILVPAGAPFKPVHRHLARLVKAGYFRAVITTNYDQLLESAFNDAGVNYLKQVIDSNETLADVVDRVRLLKIHGDVSDWKNAILTGDSYSRFQPRYGFLQQQLNLLLRQNNVLFVGCSMLDERILDWLETLAPENRLDLKTWMALLTRDGRDKLKKSHRPGGGSVWDLYQSVRLFTEPLLPNHQTLEKWWAEADKKLARPEGREELVLKIRAEAAWQVWFDGREQTLTDHPLNDSDFLTNLETLEKMIHQPFPCDQKGKFDPQTVATIARIEQLAAMIGDGLAGILGEEGQSALAQAAHLPAVKLLRVAVEGRETDRVLALPWELLRVDGLFPVKEHRFDLVREVISPQNSGLAQSDEQLRVLVHIASPEDPTGLGALNYEEEAYRLVRALQQVADDAVVFTDLGTVDDLTRALHNIQPTVVHFSGHGAPGTLLFENDSGEDHPVQITDLLAALRAKAKADQRAIPPVFYLASCYGVTAVGEKGEDQRAGPRQLCELDAVMGQAPSSAVTLHRDGCVAIVAYYGPVGDQLSTHAETSFYQQIAQGGTLTDAVRQARQDMQQVLGDPGRYYRYPLGWAQLALFLRGRDIPLSRELPPRGQAAALEIDLVRPAPIRQEVEITKGISQGFIARRREMSSLRREHRHGRRLFVLQGLGGVGKTTLALNLIPKLGLPLERVILLDAAGLENSPNAAETLWTRIREWLAEKESTLHQSISDQAAAKGLMLEPPDIFQACQQKITAAWLIYLDNAESLQNKPDEKEVAAWRNKALEDFWKTLAQAARPGGPLTFITTARYIWPDLDVRQVDRVGAMRKVDMLRMMRWRPYLRRVPYHLREKVVQWLNGHARALLYLEGILNDHFKTTRPEQVSEKEWSAALDTALKVTDEKLQNEDLLLRQIWNRISREGRRHLRILSALRRPAPREAVQSIGDRSEELDKFGLISHFPGNLMALHATVSRFTIMEAGQPGKDDHRLIGLWYKNAGEENFQSDTAEEAVYHLAAAKEGQAAARLAAQLSRYYSNNLRYSDCRRVLDLVQDLPMPDEPLVELLGIRGYLMSDLGNYQASEECFRTAFDMATSKKLKDEIIGFALHGMANALVSQGKFDEAVRAYKKALEIYKIVHGTETHPDYAASLHGMANALDSQGKFDEAVRAYKNAIEIDKIVHGTETHPNYATSLHGMANALHSQGKFDEAVRAYKKALEIKKIVHGTETHPSYAASLAGMANALDSQGKFDEAIRAYKKALEIYKIVHRTETHPDYATSLHGMANALDSQGKFDEAVRAYKKALEIYKIVHGTETHPSYAASLHGMANALDSQGKFDEAVRAYKNALEILKIVHGTETHPDYAASLHGMANALDSQGKFDEAVRAYKKVLDIDKIVHGTETHPAMLPTMANMAMTLARQGEIEQAVSWLEKAVAISENLGQPYYTGMVLFLLAQVIRAQNPDQAKEYAWRAKGLLSPIIGADHPDVLDIEAFLEE